MKLPIPGRKSAGPFSFLPFHPSARCGMLRLLLNTLAASSQRFMKPHDRRAVVQKHAAGELIRIRNLAIHRGERAARIEDNESYIKPLLQGSQIYPTIDGGY